MMIFFIFLMCVCCICVECKFSPFPAQSQERMYTLDKRVEKVQLLLYFIHTKSWRFFDHTINWNLMSHKWHKKRPSNEYSSTAFLLVMIPFDFSVRFDLRKISHSLLFPFIIIFLCEPMCNVYAWMQLNLYTQIHTVPSYFWAFAATAADDGVASLFFYFPFFFIISFSILQRRSALTI